jgi:MerR family transcriptional regulator, light-induced transcriptional regulator
LDPGSGHNRRGDEAVLAASTRYATYAERSVKGLAIKEVAERTGLAPGTIRMWEQRYGFPEPGRASSGYRVYTEDDVDMLRRAVGFRERGLSVPAALDRARSHGAATDRPSIYGAIVSGEAPVAPHVLRKRTLIGLSRAMEDEALARAAGPVVFAAFQHTRFYDRERHRYLRLAENADAAVVFADFDGPREPEGEPAEVPIAPDAALGNEWAVIIDAPGFSACLLAWERPRSPEERRLPDRERRFESLWTMDPGVVRRASLVGCSLTRGSCPALADRIERTLADRPLGLEAPAAGLTALTNRVVSYLDT